MPHPPGTIIVVSADLTRYASFSQSLLSVHSPTGTQVAWTPGVNLAGNLNRSLAQRTGEWVWLMADDHIFAADTLWRLLNREVDVVAPMCMQRKGEYRPLVYRVATDGRREFWPIEELPSGGLVEVHACGTAGLLVRERVLQALTPPYFELGQMGSDEMNEDLYFLHKVRAAGFKIHLDFDTAIGHTTPGTIWPIRDAHGRWHAGIDTTCEVPTTAEVGCINPTATRTL